MFKKIKLFLLKALSNWGGIMLVKDTNECFHLAGTNYCPGFYPSVKILLREKHKVTLKSKVEILIFPNKKLTNKLIRIDIIEGVFFMNDALYRLDGTTYEIRLCADVLKRFFGQIPEFISYQITFKK